MTLLEQLKRDEGCRLMPYRDSLGFLTIGYGRCLDRVGISQDEADLLLAHDAKVAEDAVAVNLIGLDHLDEARHAVLVNMTFNLGIGGLLQFRRFLAAVRAGDWPRAANEMRGSRWAEQVGPRAQRLATQMETGEWT